MELEIGDEIGERPATLAEGTCRPPPNRMTATLHIRPYREADERAVVALWRDSGLAVLQNDPVKDIARKLHMQRDLFLVGSLDGRVVATVMAGYDGHRGWINYLAVALDYRRQGFGLRMMDAAEGRLRAMGCPKINLQIRRSNTQAVDFYRSIGFVEDATISMGKRLVEDLPPAAPLAGDV